jgi:hypothetical protein
MSLPYKNAVCRGSVFLGTGCGHCERCTEEKLRMNQAHAAEKSDTHVATQPASSAATDPNPGAVGLPVAGYRKTQPQWALDLVNENKVLEEKVLRQIDKHTKDPKAVTVADELDQRCVAVARTKIQEAFMWLNRGVFQPKRLEGDLE